MTVATIVESSRAFIRENPWVFIAGAAAMALAYTFPIVSYASSTDEPWHMLYDTTGDWLNHGRPAVVLMKFLLQDTFPLPHLTVLLAVVFRFVAASVWVLFLAHAMDARRVGPATWAMFLVILTTLPINAYMLTFNTVNVEVSIGWIFSAVGAWLSWIAVVQGGGVKVGGLAMGCGLFAVLTYPDLGFVMVAGVLIAQLASLTRPTRDGIAPRGYMRRTALLTAPAAGALAIGALVTYVLTDRGGYTDSFIAWGTEDPALAVARLGAMMLSYWIGIGFVGGWVLIPSVLATIAVFLLLLGPAIRARFWYPLELLALIVLTPFALWALLGTPLSNHTIQAIVLVAAGIWLLLDLLLPRRRWIATATWMLALMMVVWNAGIIGRLFYTEKLTYEIDMAISSQIGERLAAQGWDGAPIPIVVAGTRSRGEVESRFADETFGESAFIYTDRVDQFMRVHGYPLVRPTAEQREIGLSRSGSMPSWPAAGSVALHEGIAVVKFSAP